MPLPHYSKFWTGIIFYGYSSGMHNEDCALFLACSMLRVFESLVVFNYHSSDARPASELQVESSCTLYSVYTLKWVPISKVHRHLTRIEISKLARWVRWYHYYSIMCPDTMHLRSVVQWTRRTRWTGRVWEIKPLDVQNFRKTSDGFRGIYGMCLGLVEGKQRIAIRSWVDLTALGFWLLMPQNLLRILVY